MFDDGFAARSVLIIYTTLDDFHYFDLYCIKQLLLRYMIYIT